MRQVAENSSETAESDFREELPPNPKVPFDPLLWQWREQGGFVNIKTGELREESEFIDPNENASDDSGDWDEPQVGGDDW